MIAYTITCATDGWTVTGVTTGGTATSTSHAFVTTGSATFCLPVVEERHIEVVEERPKWEYSTEELRRNHREKQREASKLAQEVLCNVLSKREQKYLKRHKYLRIPSTLRKGFHYRLCLEDCGGFYSEIWHKRKEIGTLCLVAGDDYDEGEFPPEDLLLIHYLLLTTDEQNYLATGNALVIVNSEEYNWLEEY